MKRTMTTIVVAALLLMAVPTAQAGGEADYIAAGGDAIGLCDVEGTPLPICIGGAHFVVDGGTYVASIDDDLQDSVSGAYQIDGEGLVAFCDESDPFDVDEGQTVSVFVDTAFAFVDMQCGVGPHFGTTGTVSVTVS